VHSRRLTASILATLVTGSLVLAVAAPAADAAPAKKKAVPVIATANGTVGISQSLSVVAPTLKGQTVTVSFALNGAIATTEPVALNAQGNGTVAWTPPSAGTWTIDGVGSLAPAKAFAVSVSPITTRTVLSTVNQAGVGVPSTMTITVEATAGNADPQGTVVIGNGSGGAYGIATLSPAGGGLSEASFLWTPPSPATFPFTASFNPTHDAANVSSFLASSSSDEIQVLATQPLVTLRLPSVFTQGDPISMTALIGQPNLGGSAAFLLNINGQVSSISGSIPQYNQQSTTSWTPSVVGNQFVTAQFTSQTVPPVSGTNTQVIAVVPQGAPDPMSVQASGVGVLKANTPVNAASGARLTLSASSGSGAAVNFAESGNCMILGNVLQVPSGKGICTLTASSPGGGAFSANTASFSVFYGGAR